jgi:hypothetical protein
MELPTTAVAVHRLCMTDFLVLFAHVDPFATALLALNFPIFVQEMVMVGINQGGRQ